MELTNEIKQNIITAIKENREITPATTSTPPRWAFLPVFTIR